MVSAFSLGKKGIFFTFAAIALALIIIFSFNVYNEYGLKDKAEVIETRVNTMNNFIIDLENDIDDAIFIVGFRSLLSLEDYLMEINSPGNPPKFFGEADTPTLAAAFDEAFRLGTIDGQKMALMNNNTILNWTERMKVQANKTGISLDFTINPNDITITQIDPWIVQIKVDLDIKVEDNKKTAKWTINNKEFTKNINITGFVDPLYLANTDGIVNNTIRRTIVPDFSSESNLDTHLLNSYYIEHSAPSYLMRFENDLSSSSNGIESLVNSQKLIDEGLSSKTRSAVDYIYYGSASTTDCIVDEPEYEWFYLDYLPDPPNHLNFYNSACEDEDD